MEGKMKVCVLTGKQKLEWVERDIPQPGKGELQIKLEFRPSFLSGGTAG